MRIVPNFLFLVGQLFSTIKGWMMKRVGLKPVQKIPPLNLSHIPLDGKTRHPRASYYPFDEEKQSQQFPTTQQKLATHGLKQAEQAWVSQQTTQMA